MINLIKGEYMFGLGTVNKVVLVGYIAKDVKKITLPDGKSKISLVVATQKEWIDGEGEFKTSIEWHNVVAYGAFADSIFNRALKRNLVYIEGRIKTRSWIDDQQIKRYITEIIIDGAGSSYQTLRKVKETSELVPAEGSEEKELTAEQKEAMMVDEIQNMLDVEVDFIDID